MTELMVLEGAMHGGEQPIKFVTPGHLIQVIKVVATARGVGVGAFMVEGPGPGGTRIDAYDFAGSDTKFYEVKPGRSLWFGGGSPGDGGHAPSKAAFRAALVELKDPPRQEPDPVTVDVKVSEALVTGKIGANSKAVVLQSRGVAGVVAFVIVDKPCVVRGDPVPLAAGVLTGVAADASGTIVLETTEETTWSIVQVVK